MSSLLGYEEVEKDLEDYSKPIFIVGPEGTGKRTWIESHIPEDKLCVKTTAKKSELDVVAEYMNANISFVWVLHVEKNFNWSFLLSLLRRASSQVTVFAYTSLLVPNTLKDIVSVHYSPYLSESQLFQIAKNQGLRDDEAEFASQAAQGIPGNIEKSFEMLRSRALILDALEYVRDNNSNALAKTLGGFSHMDIALLDSILVSFKTNRWTLFTKIEVEPLDRIVPLMEECLWNNEPTSKSLQAKTIFVAALHAYHGRV